jgi:hypothetical protein
VHYRGAITIASVAVSFATRVPSANTSDSTTERAATRRRSAREIREAGAERDHHLDELHAPEGKAIMAPIQYDRNGPDGNTWAPPIASRKTTTAMEIGTDT